MFGVGYAEGMGAPYELLPCLAAMATVQCALQVAYRHVTGTNHGHGHGHSDGADSMEVALDQGNGHGSGDFHTQHCAASMLRSPSSNACLIHLNRLPAVDGATTAGVELQLEAREKT